MVHLIKRGEKWSARVGITGVKWEMGKPTVPPAHTDTYREKEKEGEYYRKTEKGSNNEEKV